MHIYLLMLDPLCYLKYLVNTASIIALHCLFCPADKVYGGNDLIFQQDLLPTHCVKDTKTWFKDHKTMENCQEEDERHQTQQCR